ncbi:MAG: TauD/TfdA family dioxygenase, partial [Halioglobus sp.]|nr:TauD/TfdA family dioxygenase [Halioglobus sp.]
MPGEQHYYSFVEQTLHYFDRPREGMPGGPVDTPAAWRGDELPPLDALAHHLSSAEVQELRRAVAGAAALQRPTLELTAADFPLPLLQPRLAGWRAELSGGRGLCVIRGVPVQDWDQAEQELFFWCFGLHLGRPGQQNPEGDLLGHVRDISDEIDDPMARLYKTAANIDYHCDAADVVGLLCLNSARRGGQSRIVSSVAVYNALLERRPELAPRLFEPFHLDIRDKEVNEAGSTLPIPPCRFSGDTLRTFYHADYFRSAV